MGTVRPEYHLGRHYTRYFTHNQTILYIQDKVCFTRMTLACGDSQIIKTKPMPGEDEAISWKTTTLESILTNV